MGSAYSMRGWECPSFTSLMMSRETVACHCTPSMRSKSRYIASILKSNLSIQSHAHLSPSLSVPIIPEIHCGVG